eukprot:CAMPEP_0178421554 /NCGR_PEP_ID=MMETSP0689_2-20121128/26706_1 /TAXON_ID=160604 /ORGANISM="Amphidinium massartii, Strain CS-259" /LENGTH=186 /DNA_ID=CAMNT_0020043067 /DNA_START=390 /DNA_END=947 /DNA_ORIENTATION=-
MRRRWRALESVVELRQSSRMDAAWLHTSFAPMDSAVGTALGVVQDEICASGSHLTQSCLSGEVATSWWRAGLLPSESHNYRSYASELHSTLDVSNEVTSVLWPINRRLRHLQSNCFECFLDSHKYWLIELPFVLRSLNVEASLPLRLAASPGFQLELEGAGGFRKQAVKAQQDMKSRAKRAVEIAA